MSKKSVGIHELYSEDPQKADKLLWDREVEPASRRGFLKKSSLLAMTAVVGANIPFASRMPGGLIPAALANSSMDFEIPGKHPDIIVLNDRPINAELPPHLLDDEVTPADKLFVRNNGVPPTQVDPANWRLTIDGEAVSEPKTYTIADLKAKFKHHTYQLWIECGGNGRKKYDPTPRGNQWNLGAVGCPTWTGVRLRDVLADVGYDKDKAVYIGYYGADTHLSGNPDMTVISRGVPMAKALEDETIIAWAMNGEDIPTLHGHPLRLVAPGYPASASGKWLTRISVRDQVHDGKKMTGKSYRIPCEPVAPGADVPDEQMCILEQMPVKSLITFPEPGVKTTLSDGLKLRGKAWDGYGDVKTMEVSIDFGVTWHKAKLAKAKNRFAWQSWEAKVDFPKKGYYEVWARATNARGTPQPMVIPGWNPRGYGNNQAHRIAVYVDA
jgi:DMSO/TMAO reductase YedYZ molybdopterin-dependent catalytic subunit